MKEVIKGIGVGLGLLFVSAGIAFAITVCFNKYPYRKVFTVDYVDSAKLNVNDKIEAFKDSCLKNVSNQKEYNRYVDSANKYVYIYNYLGTTK